MNDKIVNIMEYYYGSISSVRKLDGVCLLENNRNFITVVDSDFLDKIRLNPSYDDEYNWISVKLSKDELELFEECELVKLILDYFSKFNCEFVHLDLFRKFYL